MSDSSSYSRAQQSSMKWGSFYRASRGTELGLVLLNAVFTSSSLMTATTEINSNPKFVALSCSRYFTT